MRGTKRGEGRYSEKRERREREISMKLWSRKEDKRGKCDRAMEGSKEKPNRRKKRSGQRWGDRWGEERCKT